MRTVGREGPLVLLLSWARQWYEPASVLVAEGSRWLLLAPSKSRAPFRYQEKRVSGVRLRPLLQLKVTVWPSTTSAAGLIRSRATGETGERRCGEPVRSLPLHTTCCRKPSRLLSPQMTS